MKWMSLFINDFYELEQYCLSKVKKAGSFCIITEISKIESINLMENIDLTEKSGTL